MRRPPRPDDQDPERDRVRREAGAAVTRARTAGGRPKRTPSPVERPALPEAPIRLPEGDVALVRILGDKAGRRAASRLWEAGRAFEEERYADARRILAGLDERAPGVADVVELLGLTQYRMQRWRDAATTLERFRVITGGTEQHPVLADCYRAQGRWADVEELWDELREASPTGALVTEGRLVAAGALADQDRLAEAVALLERGWRFPKRAREHHLRRAYALADLYERSGATPRARDLFDWVQRASPDFGDTRARVAALR